MKTAVDYIKEKLMCNEYWYENMTFDQIFEQAKDMEKDQIVDAYMIGYYNRSVKLIIDSEEYYEQNFNNESKTNI